MSDTILVMLIERGVPERVALGKYTTEITWTPLGEARRRLADGVTAA